VALKLDIYSASAIVLTLAVFIGYINHRFIKMQATIAIMSGSLLLSLVFIVIHHFGFSDFQQQATVMLTKLDFHRLLLNGMLSFLLFAGAISVDINALKKHLWEITTLATFSTIASAIIVGTLTYYMLPLFRTHINFIYCMLFGALISPTDPIAVLAIFKKLDAPKHLHVKVAGESLFNDGVGIVIFLTLYQLAFSDQPISWQSVSLLFIRQSLGGMLYGVILGLLTYWLVKPLEDHKMAILVTLAVVTGGYALAMALDISGPLAMVVAGIFLGNRGGNFAMPAPSRKSLFEFWELIDEILNAVLFLLIWFDSDWRQHWSDSWYSLQP